MHESKDTHRAMVNSAAAGNDDEGTTGPVRVSGDTATLATLRVDAAEEPDWKYSGSCKWVGEARVDRSLVLE